MTVHEVDSSYQPRVKKSQFSAMDDLMLSIGTQNSTNSKTNYIDCFSYIDS